MFEKIFHNKFILFWLFLFHNAEEALTIESFINLGKLPRLFTIYLNYFQFDNIILIFKISLIVVTLLVFLIVVSYNKQNNEMLALLMLFILYTLLINSVQHIAFSMYSRAYSPGLITATLFNLPYTIYFFRNYNADKTVLVQVACISMILYMPLLLGIWYVSNFVISIIL